MVIRVKIGLYFMSVSSLLHRLFNYGYIIRTYIVRFPSRRKIAVSAENVVTAENPTKKIRLSRISANFYEKLAAKNWAKIRPSIISVMFFQTFSIFAYILISFFPCDNDIRLACLFHLD